MTNSGSTSPTTPGRHTEVSNQTVSHPEAHILSDYEVLVDGDRRYVEVSDGFCKLLGYSREELIGKRYDDFTAPGTNDIPTVHELFLKVGYMHGIWILVHRGGTRILVRYEAWQLSHSSIKCRMQLLGAGA
jgi:PAS domain S-box-containing protein